MLFNPFNLFLRGEFHLKIVYLFVVHEHLLLFFIFKGANRYQKVVGQNGVGKGISGLPSRMYFFERLFLP